MNLKSVCFPILLVLMFPLGLGGCHAVAGYPDRSSLLQTELTDLESTYYAPNILKNPDATQPAGPTKRSDEQWRNEVLNGRIRAIDLRFTEFEQQLTEENVLLNAGSDITAIGLGSAAALSGGTTARVLAASAAALTGAKGVVDKEVFYSKTMPALLAQMEAGRKEALLQIRKRMQMDPTQYPLSEALNDVEDYYKAGTIPGALSGIVSTAGGRAQTATNQLRVISESDLDAAIKIRNALNEIFDGLQGKSSTLSKADAKTKALQVLAQVQGKQVSDTAIQDLGKDGKENDLVAALKQESAKQINDPGQTTKFLEALGIK